MLLHKDAQRNHRVSRSMTQYFEEPQQTIHFSRFIRKVFSRSTKDNFSLSDIKK